LKLLESASVIFFVRISLIFFVKDTASAVSKLVARNAALAAADKLCQIESGSKWGDRKRTSGAKAPDYDNSFGTAKAVPLTKHTATKHAATYCNKTRSNILQQNTQRHTATKPTATHRNKHTARNCILCSKSFVGLGTLEHCSKRKKMQVPPLRFAPVGMTD